MARHWMCTVFGHKVRRKRVRREGKVYVGRCRWCRTLMVRTDEGWREGSPAEIDPGDFRNAQSS